jgi:hypothetical protein
MSFAAELVGTKGGMTVADLLERLAEVPATAEVFVLLHRDEEMVTAPIADLVEVTEVDGSAVVFHLVET